MQRVRAGEDRIPGGGTKQEEAVVARDAHDPFLVRGDESDPRALLHKLPEPRELEPSLMQRGDLFPRRCDK